MKKLLAICLLFINMSLINAEEREVTFSECVDGDTAKFIYKDEEITARFLAVDTPETVHPTKEDELYGKEASDYTCKRIKEAKKIVLEFDEESDRKDKYDRYLVWVFVDDRLLQKELVERGYASVAYLYGDYKYTEELEKAEQNAEDNKLGIWNNEAIPETIENIEEINNEESDNINAFIEKYKEYIILIGALIIVSIFNLKSKKKIKTKLKRKLTNDIKKRLK